MRRKDREITDFNEIIKIIEKCDVCRIAFYDKEYPYIVPMNFGTVIENNKIELYFHCASTGKKLDLIKENSSISFEMDCNHKLITGEKACDYTMEYESVIGSGIALIDGVDKLKALDAILNKYSQHKTISYDEKWLKAVTVFKIDVNNITGKRLKTT